MHRVQRVPQTESQGRIHTSTATVAVLPEAEDVEVEIDPNDLQIDVYRSSGPGGQSVNTTDSAVRITHKPTGLVVSMQDEKSQLQNREQAMRVLRARLYELALREQQAEQAADRKAQVGTGERSEKVRTYNFPQGRVTDHRIKLTTHNLEGVLEGDLDEFTEALAADERAAQARGPGGAPSRAGRAAGRLAIRDALGSRRGAGGRRLRHAAPRRRAALGAGAGVDRAALHATRTASWRRRRHASSRSWCAGAVRREPVAQILGTAAFRALELRVDHRVLVPRPETELLVELASTAPRTAGAGRRHRQRRHRARDRRTSGPTST